MDDIYFFDGVSSFIKVDGLTTSVSSTVSDAQNDISSIKFQSLNNDAATDIYIVTVGTDAADQVHYSNLDGTFSQGTGAPTTISKGTDRGLDVSRLQLVDMNGTNSSG